MTDDPYKNEIKQEIVQDLQYRAHLNETQRQAEEYYFGQFPQHREAKSMVLETAAEFLREHPEFNTPGQSKKKIDEAVRTLGQRVDERLARATGAQREQAPSESEQWAARYDYDSPAKRREREEALDEEQERYQKMRRTR